MGYEQPAPTDAFRNRPPEDIPLGEIEGRLLQCAGDEYASPGIRQVFGAQYSELQDAILRQSPEDRDVLNAVTLRGVVQRQLRALANDKFKTLPDSPDQAVLDDRIRRLNVIDLLYLGTDKQSGKSLGILDSPASYIAGLLDQLGRAVQKDWPDIIKQFVDEQEASEAPTLAAYTLPKGFQPGTGQAPWATPSPKQAGPVQLSPQPQAAWQQPPAPLPMSNRNVTVATVPAPLPTLAPQPAVPALPAVNQVRQQQEARSPSAFAPVPKVSSDRDPQVVEPRLEYTDTLTPSQDAQERTRKQVIEAIRETDAFKRIAQGIYQEGLGFLDGHVPRGWVADLYRVDYHTSFWGGFDHGREVPEKGSRGALEQATGQAMMQNTAVDSDMTRKGYSLWLRQEDGIGHIWYCYVFSKYSEGSSPTGGGRYGYIEYRFRVPKGDLSDAIDASAANESYFPEALFQDRYGGERLRTYLRTAHNDPRRQNIPLGRHYETVDSITEPTGIDTINQIVRMPTNGIVHGSYPPIFMQRKYGVSRNIPTRVRPTIGQRYVYQLPILR